MTNPNDASPPEDKGKENRGAAQVPPPFDQRQAVPAATHGWRLYRDGETIVTVDGSIDGNIVCEAPTDFDRSMAFWPERRRLIAAAPDLLAVCREFIDALGPGGYHPVPGAPATARMRAAVTKAEGSSAGPPSSEAASTPIPSTASAARGMMKALEPFAGIELSTLYSDQDDEGYYASTTERPIHTDFRRSDVLRARAALTSARSSGIKSGE